MDFFVQQLVNGLTLGSVYALLALGYSIVYGILKLLNFAHGEVYMMGAFMGYFTLSALGGAASPALPVALVLVLMFLVAGLSAGVLGVAIERFAYRPLRDAPRIAPLITALGVSFFLQSTALLLFSADIRTMDTSDMISPTTGIHAGPLDISLVRILVIVSAALLMVALARFVAQTKLGKAMRAVAYDREAAEMMGIDVDRTIVAAFFIGSVLAGAAGVMVGLVFDRVWHLMGFTAGLKAFTAAVVGGIGNIPGAMLGGLLIGLAEAFTAGYISTTFTNLIVFGILIVVMLVRPSGLLGSPAIEKV
jgi:branched-chain amino acid transport system permease protein